MKVSDELRIFWLRKRDCISQRIEFNFGVHSLRRTSMFGRKLSRLTPLCRRIEMLRIA